MFWQRNKYIHMRIYLSTTTRTGCKNWLQEQVATGTKEMFS